MYQSQFIEMFFNTRNAFNELPISDICSNLFAGGDKPSDCVEEKSNTHPYPVIANGVGDSGIIGYVPNYQVDRPSLTISARGTIGYCAIREPFFTPVVRLITIIPNDKVNLTYLKFYLEQTGFEHTGAVQGQLTIPTLKQKKVLVPSIEEQNSFSAIVAQADKSKFSGLKSQFIEMFWGGKYTMKKLRGHIEVLRGVSYKPSDVHEDLSDNTSIVLRSNNIDGGQVNFDDLVYVDSERVSEHQVLNAGDIVMCGSNGSKKLVGKAALLNETPRENTSFGAFCLGIRCKSSIIPEYLATYFQTSLYRDKIEALGSGSNILNIKPDHIYDLEIPIPSLGEQETFVSIVKQADKSKFELKKSIEAIDKVIKSLINNI